jgi:hypothetical protein
MKRPQANPVALALGAVVFLATAISIYAALAVQTRESAGASTYSRSAIGHAGLLALLRQQGIHAEASQGASRQKLCANTHKLDCGLLILAEPDFEVSKEELKRLLYAPRVLLILPKWTGRPDSDGWISLAVLQPEAVARVALDAAFRDEDAAIVRPKTDFKPTTNQLGADAHLDSPPQLVTCANLDPVVASADGILFGHITNREHDPYVSHEFYVLSDPDVISNHGLAHGNAALALAIIDRARNGGPVIFDETIHGFTSAPSGRFRLLAARPFVAGTLSALAAFGLLIWATAARFAPTTQSTPDGIEAGRLALIANIADLLLFAGHLGDVLRRYVQVTIEDVASRLHAPDTGNTPIRADWLAQAETRRTITTPEATLRAEAARLAANPNPTTAQTLAANAYAWKQEMLRGS